MKTTPNSRSTQPPIKKTQLTKKTAGKRVGVYGNRSSRVDKQKQKQKSRLGGWLAILGAIATLTTAGGMVIGGIWLAILLIVNPSAVIWLNQFLPEWTRIPITVASPPQTLAAIQDEVRKSGLTPGEPQLLKNSELLLPLLATAPHCQTNCEKIVELRVYQPTKPSDGVKYYRLASHLPVSGPEESFVLSSLSNIKAGDTSASVSLPLTKLTPLDEKAPEEGTWFSLSGQRVSDDTHTTYGEVIHYNPEQMHLSVMMQWTSPNELLPYWQQVTGASTPELVVNQTDGLEPDFKVYQIKSRNFVPDPIYLQEITLTTPALDTQTFRNALMLARNGLWSPTLQLLQPQKKKDWSAAAQAQIDVIRLHAQVTQSQAQQAWATPSQQIFANLLDGRWEDAMLVFRSAELGAPMQEIASLLKTDSGGLRQRVEATLKVYPNNKDVKTWGALIIAAQQGRAKAIAWLKQLQNSKPAKDSQFNEINELLDHLDTASAQTSFTNRHLSQIVGTAQQVTKVNPTDWLQPEDAIEGTGQEAFGLQITNPQAPKSQPPVNKAQLQLEPQQVWYQVQVAAFNDGQRWQKAPFSKLQLPKVVSAKQLWNYLGLDADRQISIWTGGESGQSTMATVKAVSYRGGAIQLLAAGEALSAGTSTDGVQKRNRSLAYTESALRWLEAGSITVADLNQMHANWVSAILPALWRELAQHGQLKPGKLPSLPALVKNMGEWTIQLVELTGDSEPEVLLTLYEDRSGTSKKLDTKQPTENNPAYKSHTLIFSNTGALLYSELSKDANASLMAIADLGDGGPAALVLDNKSNYSLKRWSSQHQRFE